jgi:hypothetical protein
LNLKIEVARAAEKAKVIREIRERMFEWNVDPRDLEGLRVRNRITQSR